MNAARGQRRGEAARWKAQRDQVLEANIRAKDRAFTILKFRYRVDEAYHAAGLYQQFDQICTREAEDGTLREVGMKVWRDLHSDYMKGSAAVRVEMNKDREANKFMALPRELQDLIFAPWDDTDAELERVHCDIIAVQLRHWLLEVRQFLDGALEVALSGVKVAVKMLTQVYAEQP